MSTEFPKILIVGTLPADADIFIETLRQQNVDVARMPEGNDVLAFSTSMQPDLILLGAMASKKDRVWICRKLKKPAETRDIPIILMQDAASSNDLVESADDYLDSPFLMTVGIKRVRNYLRSRSMQKLLDEKEHQLQQYRSLVENSPDLIIQYDSDCRRIYINPAFEKTLQTPSRELLGKTPQEGSPLLAPDVYEQSIRKVLESGVPAELEVESRQPDGSVVWAHVRFCPEYDIEGRVRSVLSIGRDITALKQVQAMLRESEEHYREIFDNVSDVLYLLEVTPDQKFRYIEVNPAFVALTQVPRQDIIGQMVGTVLPNMAKPLLALFQQCLESCVTVEAELELEAPCGVGYTHTTLVPVFEGGRMCHIIGIGRDITARKQHESVLQQHEQLSRRFTHFAATAPGVMYTCNLRDDGSFVFPYASPGIENICGLKPEDVISNIDAFIARIRFDDFERFCAEMRKSASDSSLFYCDFRVLHPLKGMIWAEARATPIQEADGSTLWHGFMTDITERKLTEEKLWASEQSLQAIVDHSPDVLVRYDHEFRRVYISRSYIDAHGISAEEVLGKRPSDFWLSSSMTAAEFEDALHQVMEQGSLSDIEFDWIKDSGEITHHWVRAVPEYDREGNVVSVLALARDISAMKRAEADLAARERDLRELIEHIPDNIVRYGRDGCIRYINPVMAETLGVSQEEVIGKHGRDFVNRLDLNEYFAVLEQVLQTGRSADYLLVAGKGAWSREIYDNIRFAPEFSADGEVIGAIAIGRDLSVQRKLELEVALREQEFRNLADNIPDMIVRYDRAGKRIYCNHAYMNNHPAAINSLGKTIFESWWLKTPTADEYMIRLKQVMETRTPLEFTVSWDDSGGEPGYLMMHLVPEINQDGEVSGVLSMGRNITPIMRTEALLRKREQEFRTLAQNSPDMIVRYDLECRRVYINPAYSYYTGISIDDALNQSPLEIWTSLMPCTEYIERLQRVMQTRQPDRMLLEWIMPDGSVASHLMHAVAECDEDGKVSGALVIGHNITELKATERRLEDSRVQLQRLTYHREEAREEERRRVAREIHDELGQLLSVLRLGISTLDYRYGDANPDLRNKTAKMGNVIDQAIDMIHTLATRLRPAVIESGILLAVEWLVQEFSKSTGIRCEFDIPKTEIDLDKDSALALFRIVQESMTNILRHAEATHVVVSLSQDEQELTLEIRDNGKGFVPEKIGKSGTFGIIGMQERVLMMDGKLFIDSAPGEGTALRITIPLKLALEKEVS